MDNLSLGPKTSMDNLGGLGPQPHANQAARSERRQRSSFAWGHQPFPTLHSSALHTDGTRWAHLGPRRLPQPGPLHMRPGPVPTSHPLRSVGGEAAASTCTPAGPERGAVPAARLYRHMHVGQLGGASAGDRRSWGVPQLGAPMRREPLTQYVAQYDDGIYVSLAPHHHKHTHTCTCAAALYMNDHRVMGLI